MAIGGTDIFTAKLFEENPYARLNVKILSGITKKPFSYTFKPNVTLNHHEMDTAHYDSKSGVMILTLSLGTKSDLALEMEKFKSDPVRIDLSHQREHFSL